LSDLERRVAEDAKRRRDEEQRQRDVFEQRQRAERVAARTKPKVRGTRVSLPAVKPTAPKRPTVQRVTGINLTKAADKLTKQAGFVRKTGLLQKPTKPTVKQLKARLGLLVIEPILGGAQEATIGIPTVKGAAKPATSVLRIAGAVATPTPADFVAGWAFSKAGVTEVGRRALKKMEKFLLDIGDPIFPKLTPAELAEVRQWEKLGGGLTNLRRTAKKSPEILKTVEQISDFYKKNPAQFSAGASVIPEEVFIFQNFAREYDFEVDDLINFINKNDDLFSDGTLINGLVGVLNPSDVKKVVKKTTTLPSEVIDDLVEQRREFTPPGEKPEAAPPIPVDDPTPVPPIPIEIQEPVIDDPPPPPPVIIQDPPPVEPVIQETPPTPPITLNKRQREMRRGLNLRLFRGKKSMFRVSFFFSRSISEVKNVEARSFVEAVNKAQRQRKPRKKQPRLIDVVKLN